MFIQDTEEEDFCVRAILNFRIMEMALVLKCNEAYFQSLSKYNELEVTVQLLAPVENFGRGEVFFAHRAEKELFMQFV